MRLRPFLLAALVAAASLAMGACGGGPAEPGLSADPGVLVVEPPVTDALAAGPVEAGGVVTARVLASGSPTT